jgi:hypothetical protein
MTLWVCQSASNSQPNDPQIINYQVTILFIEKNENQNNTNDLKKENEETVEVKNILLNK